MKTLTIKQSVVALSMVFGAISLPVAAFGQNHSGHDMDHDTHAGMDHSSHADMDHDQAQVKKPAKRVRTKKAKQAPTQPAGQKPADQDGYPGHQHGMSPAGTTSPPQGAAGHDHSMHAMPAANDQGKSGNNRPGMQHSQHGMTMGPMQGGSAPPDARDPDAYADGFKAHSTHGMDMHDDAMFGRVMINKLEWARSSDRSGLNVNAEAWYGGDTNKAWVKLEGERGDGRLEGLRTEVLWDQVFAPFWSTQVGLRHDTGNGPSRNWAAFGVRGLAPYWFDTEATAYVGSNGMLAARAEARYDLLLTQRLILEPKVEVNLYNKNDVARGIGSGLSDMALGLRLRYEIRRQFAPYVGVSFKRQFGNTAELSRQAGADIRETKVVAGVRVWF